MTVQGLLSRALGVLVLLPAGLSFLVLGAHFYRRGDLVFVGGSLVLLALLFVRRSWARTVTSIGLVVAALEWVRALVVLARFRADLGLPYLRLVVILGAVAVVALLAALALRTARARKWFRAADHGENGRERTP